MAEQTGAVIVSPGAQEMWIHFRNASQPLYWGTAVTSPEFEEMPKYCEIYNDLSGRQEPFTLAYDGTSGLVSVTVNRLDLGVTRTLRDAAQRIGGFQTGNDNYLDRGALVLGRTDFSVIVRNQFGGTALAPAGLHVGRKYYACTLAGYKESAAGTRAMEVACVFRAWGLWQGPGQGFRCFTENPAEFGQLQLG